MPATFAALTEPPYRIADGGRRVLGPGLGDPAADRGADLLRVVGGGDLAGADRPDRLVGHHQGAHLIGAQTGQRAVELGQRVLDVPALLTDLEALADAHDRA